MQDTQVIPLQIFMELVTASMGLLFPLKGNLPTSVDKDKALNTTLFSIIYSTTQF